MKYIILALWFTPAHADIIPPQARNIDNCAITITSKYRAGGSESKTRSFKAKDKKSCEKIKRSFAQNFAPEKVESVNVGMKWSGK